MHIIKNVAESILTTMYQQTGFSILLAFLFMFLYQYTKEKGITDTLKFWWSSFRKDKMFRKVFLLAFYTAMVVFRTLLNRTLWLNPLSDVFGSWTLFVKDNGQLSTEAIENLLMFFPFPILIMWSFEEKVVNSERVYRDILFKSAKYTFLFSACIEFSQLFFRLGTFQISDFVYNTVGGILGGAVYCCIVVCKNHRRKKNSDAGRRKE